jgi:hypothetical protein
VARSTASATSSQPTAAAIDHPANEDGGRARAAATAGTEITTTAAATSASPVAATGGHQASSPTPSSPRPATASGSARVAARTSPPAIRVRSTVGHSVSSVPSTVRATQPSRLTCAWNSSSRGSPGASNIPLPTGTPTSSATAAAR